MANTIVSIALICVSFMFTACYSDTDFTGFIRSTDRINERFEQSELWNAIHPFKTIEYETDDYTLLVAGDLHIGGTRYFEKILDVARIEQLPFVLNGDLVSGKKADYDTFRSLLPDYDEIPYFLILGNHDLYFDGWKFFYEYFGSSVYFFTVKTPQASDLYICVDTGSGTLGRKQLEWLKNTLKNHRHTHRYCTIFSHVNFFRDRHTTSTNPLVNELYVLLDLFAQHKVNMVIMGHDHVRASDFLGITHYLTLDALIDDLPNASFLRLNVLTDKMYPVFESVN